MSEVHQVVDVESSEAAYCNETLKALLFCTQMQKEIVIQEVGEELPYCYSKGTFSFEEMV